MKILTTVAYDGTNYYGWQRQNGQITVQEVLENAIKNLFGKHIEIRGASRTDSGVHATGQRMVFLQDTNIPMNNLPLAINNFLPKDIKILKTQEVKENFHPQYNAKNKTYTYKIYNEKIMNPLYNNYAWHVKPTLNIENMVLAGESLVGEHNFLSFCARGATSKTFVRTIYSIDIQKNNDNIIEITINGNGFLYNMVRIISGTLAYIGYGKLKVEDMKHIIDAKDRTKAGITAPPQGLILKQINY
ncbi:MAG: tRNA pseudouridine(38-40) synthase TruA [Defluviitaleaceae bacterium]|nr:tRNA pseudouridine(38-40) synthase TruA [Defluviitaleaceae bacterium]